MTQILLPVILAGLLFIGMIVLVSLATFRGGGDVGRWAAISTMWIAIPILIGGLLFLALFIGLIYLMVRLLGVLPTYTGLAQSYVFRVRGHIIHAADLAVKPIIGWAGLIESVKAFLGRV